MNRKDRDEVQEIGEIYQVNCISSLDQGKNIKFERRIHHGNKLDLDKLECLVGMDVEDVEDLYENNCKIEGRIYNEIETLLDYWSLIAAETQDYNSALKYLNTPEVESTNNEWVYNKDTEWYEISNRVFKMSMNLSRDVNKDRYYASWELHVHTPSRRKILISNREYAIKSPANSIAGQYMKPFDSAEEGTEYLRKRKKYYNRYFIEESPVVPAQYADYFIVEGLILPGYTIEVIEEVEEDGMKAEGKKK